MTFHAEPYKQSSTNQRAVVDSDGVTRLVCMTEEAAAFHAYLLNARENKPKPE